MTTNRSTRSSCSIPITVTLLAALSTLWPGPSAEAQTEAELVQQRNMPRLVVRLGTDVRSRNIRVRAPRGTRQYDSGSYAELTATVESHPLGRRDDALRGLYAQFDFGYGLAVDSFERDTSGSQVNLDTKAWRLFLHADYLLPLLEDRLQIGALIGFGHDRFSLSANNTMPSSEHNQFRLGLVGTLANFGALMQTRFDFGYRFVVGSGDLDTAFGGGGTTRAFDIGLSMGGALELGLSYSARFSYTRYNLDFAGMASDEAATGGFDSSVAFGLQVGWIFL